MKLPSLIVISLWLLGMSLPAAAAVNAWLDQNHVSPGETVQLTLQHDGQTGSRPDLSPLQQDFRIIGKSTSSNVQIVNGKMDSQVRLNLTLVPKRSGKLRIPALQWDGQSSPPLTLTVDDNAAGGQNGGAGASGNRHIFIVDTLARQSSYVQAAVKLTVRLYTDRPLYQGSLSLPSSNDVMIKRLGHDLQENEVRNGRQYQVVERHYLLFPQHSGRIRLEGPVLSAQVQGASRTPFGSNPFFGGIFGKNPFAGMLNSTRPIRIQGQPIVLTAQPRPAGSNGHDWLPAEHVTLQQTWQPDHGQMHAGDPVTRHLHLSATGLLAAQLPDLSQLMSLPAGIKAYPDQPKLANSAQGSNVVGTRDQDIALIADRAGHYTIPALHLYWWDTTKNVQREIDLPARTLDILPGSGTATAGTAPPASNPAAASRPRPKPSSTPVLNVVPETGGHLWAWVSLALGTLWLGTLLAWWTSRRRTDVDMTQDRQKPAEKPVPPAARMNEARKAFRQACGENDAHAARRHLIEWSAATFDDPPAGLGALAKRLGNPALKPLLEQLDRACYGGGEWEGGPLQDALQELSGKNAADSGKTAALAGLYP